MAADLPGKLQAPEDEDDDDDDEMGEKVDDDKEKDVGGQSIAVSRLVARATPTLLVVGSEGAGIPGPLLAAATHRVHIAAAHTANPALDSLNVSVATAIILHRLCCPPRPDLV